MKKIIFTTISFAIILITTITSIFAWYVTNNDLSKDDTIKMNANSSYFGGGKGTSDEPYLIKSAKHLYNLAWLQDIGMFDSKVYYFKLANNIDMSNLKVDDTISPIPTIGIDKHPFIGNFNGNGYKIDNLYVSTSFPDSNEKYMKPSKAILDSHSETISNGEIQTSYNGLFGITATNSDNASESKISNFTLANANIEVLKDSLTGFICGYVSSNMSNVGVASSNITISEESGYISTYSVLTKYGIIGDYNESNTSWSGSGSSTGFGGSIDIASLAKRLNYIARSTNNNNTPAAYATYTSSNFNAKLYYSKSFDWSTVNSSGQYVALMEGTYLPLNINLETATIKGSYSGTMGSYYTSGNNTGEPVLSTNTGYIVGKNENTGSATPRLHNKTFNSGKNGIPYSVFATDSNGTINNADTNNDGLFDIFNYENISFFHYDTLGTKTDKDTNNSYRIMDDENKSKSWSSTLTSNTKNVEECGYSDLDSGYYTVKHQFAQMLSDGNTSSILSDKVININGIQLFGGSSNTEIVKGQYNNVQINNTTYDTFEMLQGGFNFEFKQTGSAKIVLGPYTSGSTSHIFPSFYKLTRSSDNKTIESYKKINAVYSYKSNYYYLYSDGTYDYPSGATKIFDFTPLYTEGNLKQNGAYYIEIPLSTGDYWFGPDSDANKCPYILYFDIGANASGSSTTTSITNIDYTYIDSNNTLSGYANITDDTFTLSKAIFTMTTLKTSELYIQIYRSINENNYVYYYFSGNGTISSSNMIKKDSKDEMQD